eukprot:207235-Rhodomonas_salina.1
MLRLQDTPTSAAPEPWPAQRLEASSCKLSSGRGQAAALAGHASQGRRIIVDPQPNASRHRGGTGRLLPAS